jgi:hypothetical protein
MMLMVATVALDRCVAKAQVPGAINDAFVFGETNMSLASVAGYAESVMYKWWEVCSAAKTA